MYYLDSCFMVNNNIVAYEIDIYQEILNHISIVTGFS